MRRKHCRGDIADSGEADLSLCPQDLGDGRGRASCPSEGCVERAKKWLWASPRMLPEGQKCLAGGVESVKAVPEPVHHEDRGEASILAHRPRIAAHLFVALGHANGAPFEAWPG